MIYKYSETAEQYAIEIAEVFKLEKHYNDKDKFLYAPDNLFVYGYLTTYTPKNSMLNFDFENKTKLR